MKHQNDLKGPSGGHWYRCSRVEMVEDSVNWEQNPKSPYTFFEAYPKKPHLQFIEAKDDAALCKFVGAWGPLWRETLFQESEWVGYEPIEHYHREREKLIVE